MPWSEGDRGLFHGPTVWRAVIILCAIGVAAALGFGIKAFTANHDAIERSHEAITKNRELGCRIGAFLVGVPIVKQPGTSQKTFEHQVIAAEDFLHALKALDCKGLGRVTTGAINKQLHALHKIVPEGGGGSTGNPHQPGSPTGGGPEPAPPRPPTTTTPAPTTTPPPSTTTPLQRVCHINPILGRVCRLVMP